MNKMYSLCLSLGLSNVAPHFQGVGDSKVTVPSFLHYEMVKKREIERGGQNLET